MDQHDMIEALARARRTLREECEIIDDVLIALSKGKTDTAIDLIQSVRMRLTKCRESLD